MATNDSPADMIEIEIDNFVSPNAANDVSNDDFVALEMDAPIATIPEATSPTGWESVETYTEDHPTTIESTLVEMASPVTSDAPTASFGSIRTDGYVAPTSRSETFDSSPLTSEEIAERDRNRAATLARRAAIAAATATVAAPGGNEVLLPDFDGSIVVETVDQLHGLSLHYGECLIRRHSITRDALIDLLNANGFGDLAPGIRTGNAQLRKVMNSLNSKLDREARKDDLRLKTWNVTKKDCDRMVAQGHTDMAWPANLDSRWCVGVLDASTDLASGMGDKLLVVSLVEVTDEDNSTAYEVQFSGGSEDMRRAVTERFDALYGTSALNVTELIAWYRNVLVTKFGAYRDGFTFLIPGTEHNQEAMQRAARFTEVLQGADIYGASPIMGRRLKSGKVTSRKGPTWDEFCINIGAGMVADVRALGQDFAMALKLSQDRALANCPDGATDADKELAVRRAVIGSDRENSAARGLLARLSGLAARARDSVSLIGRTHAKAAIDACEALRVEWVGKCHADSTSSMMAQIELD